MSIKRVPAPVRRALKRIPGLLPAWQFFRYTIPDGVQRWRNADSLRVIESLPLFTPSSGGSVAARASLTFSSANQTIPLLVQFAERHHRILSTETLTVGSMADCRTAREAADRLRKLFIFHGSDKSTVHDYHQVYAPILRDQQAVTKVLEIGIGTNNEDVVSNMTREGKPGASLRAFRDFLPNARIHGADLDSRILFQEDRIATYQVDQTDRDSLARLGNRVGDDFDLIIDDGLHAPNANLSVLLFAMPRIKVGGHVVIEDIPQAAEPLWQLVGTLMPPDFTCRILQARSALLFVAQRAPNLAS